MPQERIQSDLRVERGIELLKPKDEKYLNSMERPHLAVISMGRRNTLIFEQRWSVGMAYRRRIYFTAEQKAEIWDRCQCGVEILSLLGYVVVMIPKNEVISEIQRLADENGKPPGQKLFEKETGISKSYWNGTYWPRWSAALSEAGLEPNSKNPAIPIEELIEMYLNLIVETGELPTHSELRMKARSDENFPAASTFIRRLGPQQELLPKIHEYAVRVGAKPEIIKLLDNHIGSATLAPNDNDDELMSGTVYLLKSGSHYKIGRSSEIERRVKQISVAMPEKVELVHTIQTDDTAGIESYWHKRFAEKRLNGEWFKLMNKDVAAFRRRKFQ